MANLVAQAGMDLLLCSAQDVTEGEADVHAGQRGQLDPAAFRASIQRVFALRASLH